MRPDPGVLAGLLEVTTKPLPDCEITTDEPETAKRAFPHGRPARLLVSASIFQVPSTDTGAEMLRPAFKTPAKQSRGMPTKSMYATTKLRLVCGIV